MNEIKTENDSISSPFSRLPDEVVSHILNKSTDLKDLCFCELVCTRFARIVHQVDTITFTAPPCLQLDILFDNTNPTKLKYFLSVVKSIKKFKSVKTLCINLSPSCRVHNVDDCFRFMWKWKFQFSNELGPFVFLSPDSIYVDGDGDQLEEKEDVELRKKKGRMADECYEDAMARFHMLVKCVIHFPLLEKFYIRDSDKRGMVSLSGGKLSELKKWVNSFSSPDKVDWALRMSTCRGFQWKHCYVPMLKLPVSGYVMKGVTLVICDTIVGRAKYDSDLNFGADAVESDDKDEAAYLEAVMEIFKKHWGLIKGGFP